MNPFQIVFRFVVIVLGVISWSLLFSVGAGLLNQPNDIEVALGGGIFVFLAAAALYGGLRVYQWAQVQLNTQDKDQTT